MLKLAGVVTFLVLAAGVFLFANGAFRQPAETAVILSTLF